ncbi:MAG: amylo-alpha-1,6-glucosidase, partial [Alphaproteobacteria bacterium]|nr:amylo-alpha-1,6-glucosidase [Alphaproteobacteria bacterium]
MSDVIRHQGHAYILATSPRLALSTLTLKEGDTFAVFDRFGDMGSVGGGEQGVFHKGTRVLSMHEFRLGNQRPLLLSSTVHERNALLAADLTNPDIRLADERILLRGTLHVFRGQFLQDGALYSRTRLHNYGDVPLDTDISFLFDADFVDVFQVRGVLRKRHGTRRVEVGERSVGLFYDGLDGVTRSTRIEFSDEPDTLTADRASFRLRLPPRGPVELFHTIRFDGEATAERPGEESFSRRREALVGRLQEGDTAVVDTSNEQFNHWIHRSSADLRMLVTRRPEGAYPYAGVPWFSTVFGRDGLITALQLLWLDPSMARGVLATLAALQADSERPEQDAEPGKILHEARDGEMAALGEVPYSRYYGSADSTPLFVLLAARHFRRVGDRAFAETMWPHVERALAWIDQYGDRDGDGYVEYARHRPDGLVNQGWKDSEDSVSHDDGRLADGPIALCEVQAYVYAA